MLRRIRYFLRGRMFPLALSALLLLALAVFLAIRLPRILAPAALAERAFSFVAACLLVAKGEGEGNLAKLFLIAFVPYLGAALSLVLSRQLPEAPLPEGDTLKERLASLVFRATGLPPAKYSRAEYFETGKEMGDALLYDLNRAKTRIWLEYYILASGEFLGEILKILEEKAKGGVDVRVIYDDFGCAMKLPARMPRELKKRGIRTAVFSPLRLKKNVVRRDHRKLAIVDGAAFLGGINLADEYVAKCIRFGNWKDTAVRIEGDMSAFCNLFLRTWYALNLSEEKIYEPMQPSEEGLLLLSDSAQGARIAPDCLGMLFSAAQKSICIFTPYLSPPAPLFSALVQAARRGASVRVMIPALPDKKAVYLVTQGYAEELRRAGVEVRAFTDGFLHAKCVVADGISLVSSYNLDFGSMHRQAECGVLLFDREMAEKIGQDFETCWRQGRELKRFSRIKRAAFRLLALFAPLT